MKGHLFPLSNTCTDSAVITAYNDNNRVYEGDTVMLRCCGLRLLSIDPETQYMWNRTDGGDLSPSRTYGVMSSTLFITGMEVGDVGEYGCTIDHNGNVSVSEPFPVYLAGELYGMNEILLVHNILIYSD